MKIRGHGSAVAIALAALAVVLAATGTAVAVTASSVKIADARKPGQVARVNAGRLAVAGTGTIVDPRKPTQVARVGTSGRLAVAPPLSTINVTTNAQPGTTRGITAPTKATLALSAISYDNAYNVAYANTDYTVSLVKVTVGAAGTCFDADATSISVRADGLPRAGTFSESFPAPLQFSPTGGKAYCIGIRVAFADPTHSAPYYDILASLSAFVVTGTYNAPAAAAAARPKVNR